MENLKIVNGVLVECLNKDIASIVIPDGVTKIGDYAFLWCSNLISITIPDSVTSIGFSAFSGCSSLTSITIPFVGGSASATSVSESTLFGYIFGTSSYIGGTATKQRYGIYSDAYATYYIPSSLTKVTVTGGNLLYSAFENCKGITSVTLGNGVTSIGYRAFCHCESLTSITIPDSVTSIGPAAFCGCNNLKSQIKNYKAFDFKNNNLQCRSVLFSPTEWSNQIDDIQICARGYHYCTNLFDVFNYYSGKIDEDIVVYECDVGDVTRAREGGDSKHVTNKIKPVKRLYREDIIRILNGQD